MAKTKHFKNIKRFEEDPITSLTMDEPDETPKELPSHEQLHAALLYAEDMLERSFIPFILLGELAQQIRATDNPKLSVEKITLGVQEKHLTQYGASMLKSIVPNIKREDGYIKFEKDGIPIEIKIIKNYYEFFQRPDRRFYYVNDLFLPNPFDVYWRERDNIE